MTTSTCVYCNEPIRVWQYKDRVSVSGNYTNHAGYIMLPGTYHKDCYNTAYDTPFIHTCFKSGATVEQIEAAKKLLDEFKKSAEETVFMYPTTPFGVSENIFYRQWQEGRAYPMSFFKQEFLPQEFKMSQVLTSYRYEELYKEYINQNEKWFSRIPATVEGEGFSRYILIRNMDDCHLKNLIQWLKDHSVHLQKAAIRVEANKGNMNEVKYIAGCDPVTWMECTTLHRRLVNEATKRDMERGATSYIMGDVDWTYTPGVNYKYNVNPRPSGGFEIWHWNEKSRVWNVVSKIRVLNEYEAKAIVAILNG